MSSKCLVTGGAGFIGSHLTERLINQGHTVVVLDNLATGRLNNLNAVIRNSQFQCHQVDIRDFNQITSFFLGVDHVFHLAALADIVPSIQKPMEYSQINVMGTLNVLEASRLAGVKKFVYTASSSCYGIPDSFPTSETAPMRPQYPYALSKYLGEEFVKHWNQVYHMPCISLRLFNVYGPRSRTSGTYGAVFGVFLAQKLAGKSFTVVGDGNQTRDFTFVSDVADAFIVAAESNLEGETFNVGSGNTYSINRLVELLGGEVTYIPKRPGEPDCTFADISKIQKNLSWAPKVSFEKGVQIMLENIESWREAPVWDERSIAEATKEWFALLDKPSGVSP